MDETKNNQAAPQAATENHNKTYTYEECIRLSNYFFYERNYYQARFWLDCAKDILAGKEIRILN